MVLKGRLQQSCRTSPAPSPVELWNWIFSESEAGVPRQTNTTRKTRLDHVFGSCDLVHSLNLLVLLTFGRCDWMPPGKCCRWFHTGYENPFLVKGSAFLFSKVSPSMLANSDEGFLEGFIPFHIPKDNKQRFPGLLFAQVSVSKRRERGRAVFFPIISKAVLHIILSVQTKNGSCAVPENPLLSIPWRAPAYGVQISFFFNASELTLPIAGRAGKEICVSPRLSLVAWWIVEVLIENSNHSLAVLQITTPDSWFTPFHACCLWLLLVPRLHESIISTQSMMDWPGYLRPQNLGNASLSESKNLCVTSSWVREESNTVLEVPVCCHCLEGKWCVMGTVSTWPVCLGFGSLLGTMQKITDEELCMSWVWRVHSTCNTSWKSEL